MSNIKKSEQFYKLCEAIQHKDKEAIKQILSQDINVNLKFKSLQSPLHLAIIHFDDTEVIKMLLEKKADVYAKNYQQKTPLQLAVQLNKINAFELFMNLGVDPGTQNLNVLLNIATRQGNLTMVKYLVDWARKKHLLIDRKKSFDVAVKRGFLDIVKYFLPLIKFEKISDRFILQDVVIKNSILSKACIDLLLQHGFIVNPDWMNDKKFVYLTVLYGHTKIIEGLLNLGLDVNMKHESVGCTLLHVACLHGYFEMVKLFIQHKVDVNSRVINGISSSKISQIIPTTDTLIGKTALYITVKCVNIELVQLLLNNGATVNNDSDFFSMASIAIKKNQKAILQLLLDHGGNVNAINDEKETLLHVCAKMKESHNQKSLRHEICELLLAKGAKVDAQCSKGRTPLIEATPLHIVCQDHPSTVLDIIKLLLQHNAEIDAIDVKGKTPLFYACMQDKNSSTVSFKGVDFDSIVKYVTRCQIPANDFNFINCWKNFDSAKLLLANNANIDITYDEGITLLHLVIEHGKLDLVEILINIGIDVNSKDACGRTALHFAAKKGNVQTVESLLKCGADINISDCNRYVLELITYGLSINEQNADFLNYEILVSDNNE
ncbi:ankyrin-2-like [Chelonus insularis]|uniref:ankyrin-2-like n=1 Tax=Chelonus insularis TaxID=460826 RepID=UPI00158B88CA|nr:ankyrin-2-like [Chelonus insularis]